MCTRLTSSKTSADKKMGCADAMEFCPYTGAKDMWTVFAACWTLLIASVLIAVPRNQFRDIEIVYVFLVLSAWVTIGLAVPRPSRKPVLILDANGINFYGIKHTWNEVESCKVEAAFSGIGKAMRMQLALIGHDGQLFEFTLLEFRRADQQKIIMYIKSKLPPEKDSYTSLEVGSLELDPNALADKNQ